MLPNTNKFDTQAFIFQQSISKQFADRPTLRSVARTQLQHALDNGLTDQSVPVEQIVITHPLADSAPQQSPLLDEFLSAFSQGRNLALTPAGLGLSVLRPGQAAQSLQLETARVEQTLDALAQTLVQALQTALLEYWQEDADNGMSRWQWFAETLKDACATNINEDLYQSDPELYVSLVQVVNRAGITNHEQINQPLRSRAWLLKVTINNDSGDTSLIYPAVFFNRAAAIVCCQPSGALTVFATVAECFDKVAEELQGRWEIDALACERFEPDADVFDELARVLIDQQMLDLENLWIPIDEMFDSAAQQIEQLTDPLRSVAGKAPQASLPARIDQHLPQWLKQASATDRRAYRHFLSAMAAAYFEWDGATYFSDLQSIRDFTYQALVTQMDKAQQEPVDPDQVELHIKVAHGVIFGSGYVETKRVSLIDAALENLAGLPWGDMQVARRDQQDLPAWMTADNVKALIQAVDIGRVYPAYLQQHLRDNRAEARSRQKLFALHLRNQLPLQALESALKGSHGFDHSGYQTIVALTDASSIFADRQVAIRPLHLRLGPVLNMFVIEALGQPDAPVVLYRPFYTPSLQQYASRAHLQHALATDESLQHSVTPWYHAVVKGTGLLGANEIVHRWEMHLAPPLQDDVFQHLFEANTQALIELADHQSVSDAENRWANFQTLGWLIFEAALPLVTGPAAMAGWLVILAASLKSDLEALGASDGSDKSFAVADLLLNLVAVLMHAGRLSPESAPGAPRAPLGVEPEAFKPIAHDAPPAPLPVRLIEGRRQTVALHPQVDLAATDNAWATPRQRLNPGQQAVLDGFAVQMPAHPGEPVAQGRHKGLYRYQDKWHARVGEQFFRVSVEEGQVLIIDPHDITRPGPFLLADEQGRWAIDTRLRLRGGGKRKHAPDEAEAPAPARRAVADANGFPSVVEEEVTTLPTRLFHYVNRDKLGTFYAQGGAFIDYSPNDAYGRPQRRNVGLYVTDLAPDSMPLQKLSETLFGKNRYNAASRANKIHAVLELDPTQYPPGTVKLYRLRSPKLSEHIYVLRGDMQQLQLRVKASKFGTGTTALTRVTVL